VSGGINVNDYLLSVTGISICRGGEIAGYAPNSWGSFLVMAEYEESSGIAAARPLSPRARLEQLKWLWAWQITSHAGWQAIQAGAHSC